MTIFNRESFPYLATARTAHDLADRLKRVRPELRGDINVLQCIVTSSHQCLDNAQSSAEFAQAWNNMSAAHQALLDLKRHHEA